MHKLSQIWYMSFCAYQKRNIFHILRKEKLVLTCTRTNNLWSHFLHALNILYCKLNVYVSFKRIYAFIFTWKNLLKLFVKILTIKLAKNLNFARNILECTLTSKNFRVRFFATQSKNSIRNRKSYIKSDANPIHNEAKHYANLDPTHAQLG